MFDTLIRGTVDATRELVKLGLETKRQEDAFARMTASLGVNGQALEAALENASRGIADVSDVMTTAAQALQEGLRPEQLVKVMEIATEQSKLMGTTVTEAFNQISTAILRQQERGLKSAGIYIDLNTVLKEYADRLGVSVDRLTDYAKIQATVEAVDRKTLETRKALSDAVLTEAQAVEKLGTQWQNVKENIGKHMVEMAAEAGRSFPKVVSWIEKAAEAAANFRRGIESAAAKLPLIGNVVSTAAKLRDLEASGALAGGESGPGLAGFKPGMGSGVTPPLIKPPDPKEIQKAADALAAFRQKLVDLAIADETAQKLMGVRVEVERQSKEFPALAGAFALIGTRMEAVIVHNANMKRSLDEEKESWKDIDLALEGMDNGLRELAQPLQATGDLATRFALAGDDVKFSLGGATTAVVTFGEAFKQPIIDMDNAVQVFEQFGPTLTDAGKAALDFNAAMREATGQAAVLGSDFDFAGARISALRTQLTSLARDAKDGVTPEMRRVGAELRQALADQSLYQSIEQGFLSVTDTFTKMADGLIQGTLDIADAFENLGRNLLTNFVQLVLHQVFDPILKEAAGFVSGLIGLLTGRGGLVTGAGGAAAVGLLGALGGGGNNFSTEQVAAMMQGGTAASGGGSSVVGTLGSVASGLSTLYSAVAYVAKLPSLLELTAQGVTALGASLGVLAPSLTAAEVSAIGLAAAGGAGAGAATGGAAASLGTTLGLNAGITAGGLAGSGALFAIVSLAGFLDQLGRAEIAWRNIQQRRAEGQFRAEQEARLAAAQAGQLPAADLQTFHKDIGIALNAALNNAGFSGEATAQAFAARALAGGYQPVPTINLGQGDQETLSEATIDLLQGYIEVLDKGVDSWQNVAAAVNDFDREGLVSDLLAAPTQIALLLDLPSLQREGEAAGDTMARMVTALQGLDVMMTRLAFDADALRGDLDVLDVLNDNLRRVMTGIGTARQALDAAGGDPEKMLAAAQQLETLTRQRYDLEIEAVTTLVGMLQQQGGALAGGFAALAQAAPTLRALGLEVGGMTDALGAVVDLFGEVGDAAGQLSVLRGQVSTVGGSSTAEILATTQALTRSLSATAATISTLSDAQTRMAGLVEILGDLTAGYEAATAALEAHFDTLRRAEQERLDQSISLVEDYFDAQRSAWSNLVAASRQFEQAARRIRDQVAALRTSDLSPLNPADQLTTARQQLAEALTRFWANPAADVADEVSSLASRVLEVGSAVFSRPSPAFAALFDDVTATLEQVASASEARVTPEQESARLLAEINTRQAATLATLGVVADANKAVFDRISGGLTVFAPNDEAWLASVVAQGQDAKARLDAINAEQAAAVDALRAGFGAVAAEVVGTTTAIYNGGGAGVAVWAVNATLGGIWGTLGDLARSASETRTDIGQLVGDRTVVEALDALNLAKADDIEALGDTIHGHLETLVRDRIDALIAQGGVQAVRDALNRDGAIASAVRLGTENIFYAIRDLSAHLGLLPSAPPRHSFAEGTWRSPGGPALLHPGEVVVPAGKSAAQWMREGGFMPAPAASGDRPPSGPVTINQTIQDVRDPESTAELAARKVIRYLNAQHGLRL